jgi:2-keto-4-pentenoate hydratase
MIATDHIQQVLRDAEATATAVGPVSDLIEGGLTLDGAHDICEANIGRRLAAGERQVGYKIGFTNIAVREKLGLPDSTYGYLLDTMLAESGSRMALAPFVGARIETEICVRMGARLAGPGVTAADALAAADAIRASFEICDARIKDWKCPYPDVFADNGFSARVVLGGVGWVPIAGVDLLEEQVTIAKDGVVFAEGKGALALGSPLNAVAWLANALARRGKALEPGMIVMTGTLTAITPIEAGCSYVGTFSTLGTVSQSFF